MSLSFDSPDFNQCSEKSIGIGATWSNLGEYVHMAKLAGTVEVPAGLNLRTRITLACSQIRTQGGRCRSMACCDTMTCQTYWQHDTELSKSAEFSC